jgi:hypothetical protein
MTPLAKFRMCIEGALESLDASGNVGHSDFTLEVVDDDLLSKRDKITNLTEALLADVDNVLDGLRGDK